MKRFYYLCLIVGIGLGLIPLINWFANPELTRMQIFIEWWYVELVAIILVWFSFIKIYGD